MSKPGITGRLVDRAVAARLLEADQIEACLSALPPADRNDDDAAMECLVDAGRLTRWHVKCLKKGHTRFFVQAYKLLDFLGQGGMGIVYRAMHTMMEREVALKVLSNKRLSADAKTRFLREVRVSAKLQHPNVVATLDAGEHGATIFMAMELVRGRDLASAVSHDGAFDPDVALDVIRQALDALDYAHSQRVIHRDIKPPNIMLTDSGQVKILDMGLARVNRDEQDVPESASLTQDGQFLGTPLYMAPEQIESARRADIRSDIYSLGCTLFFLLTGKHAFAADSLLGIIRRHTAGGPDRLDELRPELPPQLLRLFARMTARDPGDRFQTPREVLEALDAPLAALGSPPTAAKEPGAQTTAGPRDAEPPSVKLPHKRGQYDLFISYRREGGSDLARSIHTELLRRGHAAYLDVVNLRNSYFDDRLLTEIEATPNFVIILTPGCLDRCRNPKDWLRLEIAHAIKHERNIVPILRAGFAFPEDLPPDIASLSRYNGIEHSHRYFDAAISELLKFCVGLNRGEDMPHGSTAEPLAAGAGDRGDSICIGRFEIPLAAVPAGPFQAGCDRSTAQSLVQNLLITNAADIVDWLTRSGTRTLSTTAFRISRFAVTNEVYGEFVAAVGYQAPSVWPSGRFAPGDEKKPVTGINLDDAEAFCRWAGVRLPRPDEWEKAARGTDGRTYPWGNSFRREFCHSAESNASGPIAVDEFPLGESPYGLRQCAGNVWEWNAPAADGRVVIRGGSCTSSCSIYGACFTQMEAERGIRREDFGFRIIVDGAGNAAGGTALAGSAAAEPAKAVAHSSARAMSSASDVRRAIEQDLVTVPSGAFVKGASRAALEPVARLVGLQELQVQQLIGAGIREVSLPAFQIGRHCVTNEQYLVFVRERNVPPPAGWAANIVSGTSEPAAEWLRLPVCPVPYAQAEQFCEWLGFRLPRVDEWEKSARGAGDDRVFPWGNEFDAARCNGAESGRGKPVAVDACPGGISPFGLLNATGNVFEYMDAEGARFAGLRGGSFEVSCSIFGLIIHEMAVQRTHTESSFGFRVAR